MPDLHERLTAAVNARLEVARAAAVGWDSAVRIQLNHDFVDAPLADAIVAYLDGNDPATVIRHCERDLMVLERHVPSGSQRPVQCEFCAWLCHSRSGLGCDDPDAPYPCDEVRDLAAAYGIEVTDA